MREEAASDTQIAVYQRTNAAQEDPHNHSIDTRQSSVVDASDTTKEEKGKLHKDAPKPTILASRHFTFPVALLMRSDICVTVARVSSN